MQGAERAQVERLEEGAGNPVQLLGAFDANCRYHMKFMFPVQSADFVLDMAEEWKLSRWNHSHSENSKV
ncbi:hypothetical protein FF1_030526 [Malus domestica]